MFANDIVYKQIDLLNTAVWLDGEELNDDSQVNIEYRFINNRYEPIIMPNNLCDGIPISSMKCIITHALHHRDRLESMGNDLIELVNKNNTATFISVVKFKDLKDHADFIDSCQMTDNRNGNTECMDHILQIESEYAGQITYPCIMIHDEEFQNHFLGRMIFKSDFE